MGGSFRDYTLQSRAWLIDGPIPIIHMLIAHGETLVPFFNTLHEGVHAIGRDAVVGIVEPIPAAVDVVGTGGCPEAVLWPGGADRLEGFCCIGVVFLGVG